MSPYKGQLWFVEALATDGVWCKAWNHRFILKSAMSLLSSLAKNADSEGSAARYRIRNPSTGDIIPGEIL